MIAFAWLDENGVPIGGGSRRELPEGAVELCQPFGLSDLPLIRFRDGRWERRDDLPPEPEPTSDESAAALAAQLISTKILAIDRINQRAGDLRKRIYTDIPGQDALYLEKRAEAVAYVAAVARGAEPASLKDYPLLDSEVGVTAPAAWHLAQVWLNRSDQFKRVGAATERARMQASIAISAAPDTSTIESIEAQFNEALNSLPL